MNHRLSSHLNLHLKNIFALKKSTFANLLMEKPSNGFAKAQMREKHLKKKEILRKGNAFSVSRTSSPNGLFQLIS